MHKFYLKNIMSGKVKNLLITLSVSVGVMSVILIDALSVTGTELINTELDSLGLSGLSITANAVSVNEKLNNSDLEKIINSSSVISATPLITTTGYLRNESLPKAVFCGIDSNAENIISYEILWGKNFSKNDIENKNLVCLVDKKTYDLLFEKHKTDKLNALICGKSFEISVVGVINTKSSILESTLSEMLPTVIYLPYTTLQDIIGNQSIDQIAVNVGSDYSVSNINNILNKSVKISDLNSGRDEINAALKVISLVLKVIGGISLFVSGIGITAVTLMCVRERRKEIGIKKSLGAKNKNIVGEFLFEFAFTTFLGSVFGCTVSAIIIIFAENYLKIGLKFGYLTGIYVSVFAVLLGIFFSLFPALKAARLKPIDALKEE